MKKLSMNYIFLMCLSFLGVVLLVNSMEKEKRLTERTPQPYSTVFRREEKNTLRSPRRATEECGVNRAESSLTLTRGKSTKNNEAFFSTFRGDVAQPIYDLFGFRQKAEERCGMYKYYLFVEKLKKFRKYNFSNWENIIAESETLYETAKERLGLLDENYPESILPIPCFKDSRLQPSPLLRDFFLREFRISPEILDLANRVRASLNEEQLAEWEGNSGSSEASLTCEQDEDRFCNILLIQSLKSVQMYAPRQQCPSMSLLHQHSDSCSNSITIFKTAVYHQVGGFDGGFYIELLAAEKLSRVLTNYLKLTNIRSLGSGRALITIAEVQRNLAHRAEILARIIRSNRWANLPFPFSLLC
jgi:hypothetical protein